MWSWNNRSEWERRRLDLRWQILNASRLLPFPPRAPMGIQVVRRNRHEGYRTEADHVLGASEHDPGILPGSGPL